MRMILIHVQKHGGNTTFLHFSILWEGGRGNRVGRGETGGKGLQGRVGTGSGNGGLFQGLVPYGTGGCFCGGLKITIFVTW